MNEFYEVRLSDVYFDGFYFFKSKDKAFSFLWQKFLNACSDDITAEKLEEIHTDMLYWYCIENFGEVIVRGFED